jgi:hypothetical protein
MILNFRSSLAFRRDFIHDFDTLISSLIATISAFDAHLKFNETTDGINQRFLLRNLFLLLWHFYHTLKLSCAESPKDPFRSLVILMIKSNEPSNVFVKTVQNLFIATKKQESQFLRFAVLFQNLSLSETFDGTNWSTLVEPAAVLKKFQVELTARKQIFKRQIQLITLPSQFLDFAKPPFNISIDNHAHQLGICLWTGKLVSMERNGSSYQALANHMESEVLLSVTYVLMLTGPLTSAFYLVVRQENTIRTIPPIYVDSHGDEDIGFVRGQLLFLNKERLAKYEAMLLSGEWTDFDAPT